MMYDHMQAPVQTRYSHHVAKDIDANIISSLKIDENLNGLKMHCMSHESYITGR